jgi:hypothetical protein
VQSRKRFPKEGKLVTTARGEEKVVSNDIFNERVTLRSAEGETRVVPLAQLRLELAGGPPTEVPTNGGSARPDGNGEPEAGPRDSGVGVLGGESEGDLEEDFDSNTIDADWPTFDAPRALSTPRQSRPPRVGPGVPATTPPRTSPKPPHSERRPPQSQSTKVSFPTGLEGTPAPPPPTAGARGDETPDGKPTSPEMQRRRRGRRGGRRGRSGRGPGSGGESGARGGTAPGAGEYRRPPSEGDAGKGGGSVPPTPGG